MKKRFNSLWSAIIYYSLVVVLFGLIIGCCIINRLPLFLLVVIGFASGFMIGTYLNKIIKVVKIMRVERKAARMTTTLMIMLGFTKEEIKKQKKEFNRSKVYILK